MDKHYECVIIGGGPAGLTAGIYACRYGLKTLIIEKFYIGGQINYTTEIKNYPSYVNISGQELSAKMKEHFTSYSGNIVQDNIQKIDFKNKKIFLKNGTISYDALILALGATARKLNLDNEDNLMGHGISYCAICDGYFFKGQDVIIVGSGDSALEDANYLCDIAKNVSIVSKSEEFKGQKIFIDSLKKKKNITYYMGYMPSKIYGKDTFEGIEISSITSDKKIDIKANGMFVQIGRRPDASLVKDYVECSPAGFIKTDNLLHTNIPGIFAAGDIRETPLRQIVTACADGALCANQVFKFVEEIKEQKKKKKTT